MKKISLVGIALFLMFWSFSTHLFAETTVEEVRAMVRDVELPGADFATFALDLHMHLPETPVHFFCQLRYQAPDNFSLHVFDGRDNTPILVVCDGMALINDPFAEKLTVIASAGVAFNLQPQDGQYTANFAFNQPVKGEINNHILLDFKTMFSRLQENIKISTASEGSVLFSGSTKEKSRCLAEFTAAAALPLSTLQLFVEDHSDPVLDFSTIKVDAKFAMSTFPLQEMQKMGIVGEPVRLDGAMDVMSVMTWLIKGIFARAAISAPEMREQVAQMLNLEDYDWQSLSSKDAERSAMLRKLFPENSLEIRP